MTAKETVLRVASPPALKRSPNLLPLHPPLPPPLHLPPSLLPLNLPPSLLPRSACSENLPPQVVVRLAKEVRKLATAPPEGIAYLATDDDSMGEVHAEVAGPVGTPFEGHFFSLKLVLSADFPSSPPRGFFLTKIYHPNVNPQTGDICVNTLKKDWTASTTISHVLSVIRCLLIVPFPESSLNDEVRAKRGAEPSEGRAERAR